MNRLDHDRMTNLLAEAVSLPASRRSAFLDSTCVGEPQLRRELEELLACSDRASVIFDAASQQIVQPDPDRIGPYTILESIGEGGMAIVYKAQQEHPIHRIVAIKLIKLGMDTRQVIRRFDAEREALAMMDHPNIARVLDAGATDTGRPYFVMELVGPGAPGITDYCDEHNLSIRQRLELLLPVCQAVQHAHQKGIIHRDIKPSNVLVSLSDGIPIPKVIDFGIAKAINQRLTEKTIFTESKQLVGTPAYMSPEQAELGGIDVDTRSDIYSLGVLMYELLTGVTPFDTHTLRSAGYDEIQRIIREVEPPKPSTRLSTLDSLPSIAARRHIEPRKLTQTIRGDLDWIVMKCLEKDRARRYDTAEALGADIARYLSDQPVTAGPASRWYRARKVLRRHKTGVAASAAMILLLLAGITATTWQAIRATRAERQSQANATRAEAALAAESAQRKEAEAVTDLLRDMLSSADPHEVKGRQYSVRESLDEFESKLAGRLAGQPLIEAGVRSIIGNAYRNLSVLDKAERNLAASLDIRRRVLGEHALVARSLLDWAALLHDRMDYVAAERHIREALEMQRRLQGAQSPEIAKSLAELSVMLSQLERMDEAEAVVREALTMQRRLLGDEHPEVARSLHYLAQVREMKHDWSGAETYYREALALRRKTLGEQHPDTAMSLDHLAGTLRHAHRYDEAAELFDQALVFCRNAFGDEHPRIATLLHAQADLALAQHHLAVAEALHRQGLEMMRRLVGEGDPRLLVGLRKLAWVLQNTGHLVEAEELFREALDVARTAFGEENKQVCWAANNLGLFLWKKGDPAAAEPLMRQALEIARKMPGIRLASIATNLNNLGIILRELGDLNGADQAFQESIKVHEQYDDPHTFAESLSNYAVLREDKREFAHAEQLYRRAIEMLSKLHGHEDPSVAIALNNLALMFNTKKNDPAAAEPLFRQSLAMRRKRLGGSHPDVAVSCNNLGKLLQDRGEFAEAESLHREALEICRKLQQDQPLEVAFTLRRISTAVRGQGRFDEAELLARESIASIAQYPTWIRNNLLTPWNPWR